MTADLHTAPPFWTSYEHLTMRCSCSCGWVTYAVTDEHGDRLLNEHTQLHVDAVAS